MFSYNENSPFRKLCTLINEYNSAPNAPVTVHLKFKNLFFERISRQCSLVNWVDIENEYYTALKELLQEESPQKQSESIRTLNKDFDDVKGLLEDYLTKVTKSTEVNVHQSIKMLSQVMLNLMKLPLVNKLRLLILFLHIWIRTLILVMMKMMILYMIYWIQLMKNECIL